MKGLPGLIKIEQQALEAKRKALADLERLLGQYRGQLDALDAETQAEAEYAAESGDAALALGRFLAAAMARRKALVARIAKVEADIEGARAQVAEAYKGLRKYEIAHERNLEEKQDAARRREQQMLDELGIDRHRRKANGAV